MASTNFEEEDSPLYSLEAAANRLGRTPEAVRQAIKRRKTKGSPLIIGDFKFLLVAKNAYIAVDKDWSGILHME